MTKSKNRTLDKAHRHGNITQTIYQKSILSHLNILDLEEDSEEIDDYDC
jgi:hypothetical protein